MPFSNAWPGATPEAARAEGVAIAREMLMAVRDTVQGAQISAPQGRYSSAVDVLEALGRTLRSGLKLAFPVHRVIFYDSFYNKIWTFRTGSIKL